LTHLLAPRFDPGRSILKKSDGTLLASFAYTLNATGHRTKLVETIDGKSRTIDYTYDNLYRLTQEKVTSAHADLNSSP